MSENKLNESVKLENLNEDNWLHICDLSVSAKQKEFFPIPNIYWIGISRYEEHTELFAIKYQDDYVGLIGGGYDEDGTTGFINPLMIDEKYQKKGFAVVATKLMIQYLVDNLHVTKINISHRKVNAVAGQMYEKLGFRIVGENETEYFRSLEI
jgi:RimJ/RimL family protein N-acetyltransferase